MNKVLASIVTYNRLNDLKKCIEALHLQTFINIDILIVDNGSTDGTKEWLDSQIGLITIHQQNVGGAGGFYAGMKYMMEHCQYEWLLMMDDDGVPDKDEVKNLLNAYDAISNSWEKEVILNALVVDKDDPEHISFSWKRGSRHSNEVEKLIQEPFIEDIHPFNGTLIRRSIIEKIGLIKREMFIWGDEKEYMARAVHHGIGLVTATSAVHYHPKEKGVRGNIIPFYNKYQILIKPKKMSHFYYRNEGFIYYTYPERRKNLYKFCAAYMLRFLTHGEFREMFKFIKFFRKGMKNQYDCDE